MPSWSGGGGGLALPIDIGPGLFQVDAHGNVQINPNAPPVDYPTTFAALTITSDVEGAFIQSVAPVGASNPPSLEVGSGSQVQIAPGSNFFVNDTAFNPLFAVSANIPEGTGAEIGLYGAGPVAQHAAIPAPSGGATQDDEARTAIGLILAALGATTGIGITA